MIAAGRALPLLHSEQNRRLVLLIGQSVSLGLTLACIIITGSAVFLPEFGSGALAYVYLIVALLGASLFYGYAALQRRVPLPRLTNLSLLVTASLLFLIWAALTLADLSWASFALMVSFSLFIQMGFVILGAQAGRLFDLRQVKSLFPRIVAGFVLGFMIGGVLTPALAQWLGSTENALLGGVATTLTFLLFALLTDRRYHAELVAADAVAPGRPTTRQPIWQLLAKRFVLLIVLYQMLSAVVSQLLDFVLFDQAAARFPESLDLARFFGGFTVGVNLTDLLFLSLFAGILLTRFGLGFGLAANAVIDGIIMIAEVAVLWLIGPDSVLFFTLVVGARVADIAFTDGTTRGSINTAYQGLPAAERVVVQTGVEGIGAPLALGLVGIVILIYNAIDGLTVAHLTLLTLIVTVVWTVSAILVYRSYGDALVQTLRRRALSSEELTLDDSASLTAVERFLSGSDVVEIRLALDALEAAGHETLAAQLGRLATHEDGNVRAEALARIERLRPPATLAAVRHALDLPADTAEAVAARGAALRAYAALLEADALETLQPLLADEVVPVRVGAAVGLLRYGGIAGVMAAGNQLLTLAEAPTPADRELAARIIGEIGARQFYQPLLPLLKDEAVPVRCEAIDAAGRIGHPRLLPLIAEGLHDPRTRSHAMAALVACGEAVVPLAAEALERGESHVTSLLRVCGQVGGESVISLLHTNARHPNEEVRDAVLVALHQCGYEAEDREEITAALEAEVAQGGRLVAAHCAFAEGDRAQPLGRALDELLGRVRQRLLLLLSFLYDSRAILEAGDRLQSADRPTQSLALESLEVMVSGRHKALVLPLLDPRMAMAERRARLDSAAATPERSLEAWLEEFIANPDERWPGTWLRACALYRAGTLTAPPDSLVTAIQSAVTDPDPTVRETAAWALHTLAPDRYARVAPTLRNDPDPTVSRVAEALA